MKDMEELIFCLKAGYAYIYCESQEVNKTVADIKTSLDTFFETNKNGIIFQTSIWDFEYQNKDGENQYNNPDDFPTLLESIKFGVDSVETGTIIIAKNLNWFLLDGNGFNKTLTSWLLNRAEKFSTQEYRKILIIVGNESFNNAIPEILKRDFAQIEFELPKEKEIKTIYDYIVNSAKENKKFIEPTEKEKIRIISAAKGLTSSEITKVFSFSIIKNEGIFDAKTVEELRAAEINNTPGLKIGKYDKNLDDLKGYEVAKEIAADWIDDPESKGMIILGPAGVGKTHFCQAIASYYNRLVIEVEFAQLMGEGLVGQAEKAMKKALDVITANANPSSPIIVFVDEIEKGLAGTSGAGKSGGVNDGGTTDRSNSQFLKFLSDERPKGVYIVATCNDIEKLPAAFCRTGRWDVSPIFVDLPNKEEQDAILAHYQKTYGISDQPKDMNGFSGAEIQTWCKLAAKKISKGKSANEADELVIPISKTMDREIDYLRKWKEGRTIPASRKIITEKKDAKRSLTI